MKFVSKFWEYLGYLSALMVIVQIFRGRRIVAIIEGQKGDVAYSVKFENGKLVARAGDPKLGFESVNTLDGVIVGDAVIDLIETMIPGDQTAQRDWLKNMFHAALQKQIEAQGAAVAKA